MQNKDVIVTINGVSKYFDKMEALKEINLNIYKGEVLSILGPNGAGKTTLINLLLGRMAVSKGEIEVFGNKPGKLEIKRNCGAMLQISAMPDNLTVKEQIDLFQCYYGQPMAYEKVIELAGLNEIENHLTKKLSGGQKQRLLFALAICGNPKLLFLDEPSVGLDITARKSLWKAIRELKQSGTSIILTTHYLEEADQLSDRIVMLNSGRIMQQGTPEVIKSKVNFNKVIFKSASSIQVINKISAVIQAEIVGNYFELQTKDPIATLKHLFEKVEDISDLTVSTAALEDAFVELNQQKNINNIAA